MTNINWLDYSILILAVFSVNYLVINEGAIIFSKKSYLSKWGLCFIVSMLLILLHKYSPYSYLFLLALSITGVVEIISNLILLIKKKVNHSLEVEIKQLPDIVDLMSQYYQNQQSIVESKSSSASTSKSTKTETPKKSQDLISRTKIDSKEPKVIKSNRLYELEEFIKESEGHNIILSTNLRSNLQPSKPTEKNKT